MPSFSGSIALEINPPLILQGGLTDSKQLANKINDFLVRCKSAAELTDSLFVTDSVLGRPRVSSLFAAQKIKQILPKIRLFCSLRTCELSFGSILRLVAEAESIGVEGILLIKGDRPTTGLSVNNDPPSKILASLREVGFKQGHGLSLYLSADPASNPNIIRKKILAKPDGMVTQLLDNEQRLLEIQRLIDDQGIELIPCIMAPTKDNDKAAKRFQLTLQRSVEDARGFARGLLQIGDGLIISSPGSFDSGLRLLKALRS